MSETQSIEDILKSIPSDEYQAIEEIPAITEIRIKGISDLQKWVSLQRNLHGNKEIQLPAGEKTIVRIHPIADRWTMTHAIGAAAHFWQLDRLPGGRWTWADDPIVCISDIWMQIYENGWIIKVMSATDVRATYKPDIVQQITEIADKLHQRENAALDTEIALAATLWSPIFPEKQGYDEKIVNAAKGIMHAAKQGNKAPAECIEDGCVEISADGFRDALLIGKLERENADEDV